MKFESAPVAEAWSNVELLGLLLPIAAIVVVGALLFGSVRETTLFVAVLGGAMLLLAQ